MKRSRIRKIVSGILITILTAGTLSACRSNNPAVINDNLSNESTAAKSSEQTVTIYAATGGSPKPFTFVDSNNQLTGHNIELIRAIFEKLPQYQLELEVTDFPSVFAGLDSDRYQIGVNNFAKNEKREEKYLFTDPIFANQYVAILANDSEHAETISTWDDLAGLKTISQAGINITTALENYNAANPQNPIIIEYSDQDLVLQIQDVEAGKYDFVLMDKPMYEYYQKEFAFQVTGVAVSNEVASDLMPEPFSYLIVSKGNEQLVAELNQALKEVITDGTSAEINQKWFGSDYSPAYE